MLEENNKIKKGGMTRVRFVSTISKMGDRKIILIPKDYHDELDKLKGKQVRIVVDDEF